MEKKAFQDLPPLVVEMPQADGGSVEVVGTTPHDIIVLDPESGPSLVPLPVDEPLNHEAAQALDPIVLEKTIHGPIDDWLVWPKTPEKKGKRVQKMMPYVITSRAWQIENEEEMMMKEEARKIKEERATKRKQAKESKEESKAKAKKKPPQKIIPKGPQRRLSFSDDEEGKEDDDEVVVESDTEEHCRMDGPSCSIDDLEIDSNNDFIRGMCFLCTRSLNATNPGRACEICDRLFHNTCENLMADSADIKICCSCNNLSEDLLGVEEVNKII